MQNEVFITGISKFLPNNPVSNEEMEEYLGMIDNRPSKARRIVLRNNGIITRYYALEKGGKPTHSNAMLAAEAVKLLFNQRFRKEAVRLLACGTASPDQIMPSHASMVHGLLDIPSIEIASFAGSCCASIQALKYGYMSVMTGMTSNAVITGSEILSHWMRARYFENETKNEGKLKENPLLAFEKEFLRWMLSDGAGAILLENKPAGDMPLRVEWIETRSYANIRETCMYAGADKGPDGELLGWYKWEEEEWLTKSIFSLKQDTRMLGENIVSLGGRFLKEVIEERNFDISSIDYFLPHISSEFFREPVYAELEKLGISIPKEKWFTNLRTVGNVATVSFILMLEELMRTRTLQPGQKILVQVPESARFTYAYALFTVC
ncbi:MAG: beta-ketoacyl-ACP synthase III [Bacteroidales bacterium]|nr:beta-ketoacyl-ACP synthase III [Bacteroidales bacterium]